MKKFIFTALLMVLSFSSFAQQEMIVSNRTSCHVKYVFTKYNVDDCSYAGIYQLYLGPHGYATINAGNNNTFSHVEFAQHDSGNCSAPGSAGAMEEYNSCYMGYPFEGTSPGAGSYGCEGCETDLNFLWEYIGPYGIFVIR